MAFYPYRFEATVALYDVGSAHYVYMVIWLPDEIAARLPLQQHPRLRISGEANEVEFKAALMPVRGRWYILFSAKSLKVMEVSVGGEVCVAFAIDDQDNVDIPDALARALANDGDLALMWARQTPGKKRGLAFRVASAKSAATCARRVEEVKDIMAGKRDQRGKRIVT